MSMTTILLADDHQVVREGFRALLKSEPDFKIVGEAGDGIETVRLAEQLRPAVVVADVMMPSLNGLEVTRQIVHRLPDTKVVLLSMHADEGYVVQALHNGASAYVLKDASSAELVRAVRESIAGRRYLSPPLSEMAIRTYMEKTRDTIRQDLYETLTDREREVLQQVAEGHTNSAIAARLHLSPRTVETHRANLMHKLSLGSQADLVRYAVGRGMVSMDRRSGSPLPKEPPPAKPG
jgi:two-component system, NarL family, response regulator NreC